MGMRLIDADTLADALFDKRKNYPQWVADTIGAMPDAVVRCKDCKHGRICNNWILGRIVDCPKGTPHIHNLDWFCADGERKTDDA